MQKINKIIFFNVVGLFILAGCATREVMKSPMPSFYDELDSTLVDDGFSIERQPLIVFSDQNKNKIASRANTESFNNPVGVLKFLSPLLVLNRKNGFLEVAEYKPDVVKNGRRPRKKKLNVKGWVPEENLLMWTAALKATANNFVVKAAVVVNNEAVFEHPEKYLDKDSILLYDGPDLNVAVSKVQVGSLIYVYKQSEDKQRLLVGSKPFFTYDSVATAVSGWVSKEVVSMYGQRSAVKVVSPSDQTKLLFVGDTLGETIDMRTRMGMENIYPISMCSFANKPRPTKFFVNPFDYSKNKIYNVLGHELFYDRYKEILAANRKLNIVFVVDLSQNNALYIPAVKSMLQELQLNMLQLPYYTSVQFGGVVYKNNNCRVQDLSVPLTADFRTVTDFFEKRMVDMSCGDNSIDQPVDSGVLAASRLLIDKKDEANVIIVIGTTANFANQSASVTNALTRARAKLIFFQTQSKSSDYYNDYVLLAQRAVMNSAANIVELKKEKIVSQENLLLHNNFNLTENTSGVYFLDYPKKSMTQGYVVFPKKGDAMPVSILKTTIDSLIAQITHDNQHIDEGLTKYFNSNIGLGNTTIQTAYHSLIKVNQNIVPPSMAADLLHNNTSFLLNAKLQSTDSVAVEKGVLLNEEEYDQLIAFYTMVHTGVFKHSTFKQKRALKDYALLVYQHNTAREKPALHILYRKLILAQVNAIHTGYLFEDNEWMGCTLYELRKQATKEQIRTYFESYKILASHLATQKNDVTKRVVHGGQVFYWLRAAGIPVIKPVKEESEKEPAIKGQPNFS